MIMNNTSTWLGKGSIQQALEDAVGKIKGKNLDGALDTLISLNFERLLRPITDKGPLGFVDPLNAFGPERVHETAEHIRLCEAALQSADEMEALIAAQAALDRWKQSDSLWVKGKWI